jgi:hypothetical protein
MSDLVERLCNTGNDWPASLVKLEAETADEIEAQVKEIERLKSDKETLATGWEDAPSGTPMGRIKHHRGAAKAERK